MIGPNQRISKFLPAGDCFKHYLCSWSPARRAAQTLSSWPLGMLPKLCRLLVARPGYKFSTLQKITPSYNSFKSCKFLDARLVETYSEPRPPNRSKMSDALAARHVQNFVEILAFVLAKHSYLNPWPGGPLKNMKSSGRPACSNQIKKAGQQLHARINNNR